ncbi:GlcNAc-domain-containing protein [Ochromonadaceae sp. CCMP2298]|nr:GlcNAc-domain-containing protein [Ochromonadaceae sp. CCMP2298]
MSKDLGWQVFNESGAERRQHPIIPTFERENVSIYMTMSSYRDKLCPGTLFNLFNKAANPHRISVGVVQQNAPGDVDCLNRYCEMMKEQNKTDGPGCPFEQQVKMMRLGAEQARGPTWARALGSTLMEQEEFCLQTDSHMDFVPDWDVKMIDMWALTGNEYAVLSTYVADSSSLKDNMPDRRGTNNAFEVPHLCMITLSGSHGMVRNWGTKCMRNMPRPKLTNAVWGAGLSFSKCHAERKAPYDPHTPHIFDGEEFSRALRFWTWGYDIYSPHRVYIVHHYKASQSDPIHSAWASSSGRTVDYKQVQREMDASVLRLKQLMGMGVEDLDPAALKVQQSLFGLGDRRTLDQAIRFSGIDTKRRKVLGNMCGNLEYVPFEEHPWGVDYIPKYDKGTEEYVDVRDPGSVYFDQTPGMMEAWQRADAERAKVLEKGGGVLNGEIGESRGDPDTPGQSEPPLDTLRSSQHASHIEFMDDLHTKVEVFALVMLVALAYAVSSLLPKSFRTPRRV